MDIKNHPTLLSGLIAYYKLDGNANDAHTNALNGTAVGTPTWPTAMLKTGVQTNGSSQYIDLGTDALFSPTAISISAWVYLAATPSGVFSIVTKRTAFSTWADLQWTAEVDSARKIRFEVGLSDSTGVTVLSASVLTLSTWYHVACVYDGTDARVYLNGYLNNTAAGAGTINSKTYPCVIGARADGSTPWTGRASYLNGRFDEVAIANRGWTPAEVIDLYHSGYPLRYEEVLAEDLLSPRVGGNILEYTSQGTILNAALDFIRTGHPTGLEKDISSWFNNLGIVCLDPESVIVRAGMLQTSPNVNWFTHSVHPIRPRDQGIGSGIYIKKRS
jgi:hypothetical protein